MDREVVQHWLSQVLVPYAERDRVARDLNEVLDEFLGLLPRTDVYTYDDGRAMLLLLLDGTLPVEYANATYNIPMNIWIPREYPVLPPMIYVAPTKEMEIRRSFHVDPSGRVRPEEAEHWTKKSEAANLVTLLHACQHLFHHEPPVVAKLRQPNAAASSSRNTSATLMHATDARMSDSRTVQQYEPRRPENPVHKPMVPPRPPTSNSFMEPPLGSSQSRSNKPPVEPRPSTLKQGLADAIVNSQPRVNGSGSVPMRPINPQLAALQNAAYEKLSARRLELRDSLTQANRDLRATSEELQAGKLAIHDEMQRLRAVRSICETRQSNLTRVMRAAEEQIADLHARPNIVVDNMLTATSLAENQLVQLVADDAALEDTMYQLGRALYAEELSLDQFLRQVRILSQEQFFRRALAKKIIGGLRENS
ncbi:suppressor protein stp22 of temperature-sensitive alpha-factor receptor and arginine permease [Malassezia psittaci]|uniref:Suppressor protein stp22 of temperature-sensitive alpha-factor receptor and arginine permease n=1 Tax=Malassezia psittaci TaxID=1821823 RepID=A0AAF0F287_9BASI|nr:suppressor protein stp22 of temperature-sensitive alpha-factor receptor and arginine permease [Malassezia psittaci]